MIWILLVVYQIKHFLADYPLQTPYMLGKFKPYPAFILPLLSHGAVHAVFTFLIALCLKDWHTALALGLLDMTVHSVVDWVKANPSLGGRFVALTKSNYYMPLNMSKGLSIADGTPLPNVDGIVMEVYKKSGRDQLKSNVYFWWALGADQMAHHLTHYIIIALLVMK